VIIENRAGAGGALGARTAAAARSYTLFYGNTSTLAVIRGVEERLRSGEELRAGRKRVEAT
jgi:tripartite-type tricarboxylate transporter receptor subunit TctC